MIAGRDPGRILLALVAVALAGAAAFGLWHVIVGGLINGNARAAGFGLTLAVVAAGLLVAVVTVGRRRARA